ncbi:unnamed protein product [Leptidea sinapis]|uniref:Uncharacterized protein n=1 Tax=Leptidea sinapis TaxID=189913 RepID=A0A5E4QBP8_9NEOP|nr:unnamed protein product [Leptidea sinapis]
MQWSWCGG